MRIRVRLTMIDVKERKLSPLLPEHYEERVNEVEALGEVEEPKQLCNRGLAPQGVAHK